jgi:hypothetical protein
VDIQDSICANEKAVLISKSRDEFFMKSLKDVQEGIFKAKVRLQELELLRNRLRRRYETLVKDDINEDC